MEEEQSFCLMKENSKEISAIGLRMKKMEQKDSWMPQKMYFGSGMTMTILGIREDSKEEEQGKEKEKDEKEKEKDVKDEDFSDLETKEKEREKERVTLQVMRVIGLKMNGKEMRQTIGVKAIGPMKMKQHGSPKHGMNGKKIITMSTDISKEKERKERKEKEKARKVMDLFANSQQTRCTEKLVIHMYDKAWSVHTTEFDIVAEGNVPLLMSLPQMRNLGFQFELSPQQSFLNCTRLGMWKHKLRMSKSTHLVMDFQDIAWYMSAVYFKTPEVQSFFSQSEHFEYSQLSVGTFAFATDDDWEIDYHRKELIRHHKTYRSQLFKIVGSKCPIAFDDLESTRKTFIEMKNGTKKVETDDWRAASGPEKRLDKQWCGRTVFKIKSGVELPGELSTVKSPSKLPRISDPSDKVKPEHLPAGEISEKPKSSSSPDEVDKSRGPDSSGPRRRLGQKTGAVAKDEYEKFSDEFERGLDRAVEMELEKSGSSKDRRPKGDDVEYSPSSDDERWEKVSKKPGNESLEPRRISVPLPGSEAQALTPAYRKMIKRLDDKVELYKLHVKHYHMSPTQFRRRTSMLNLPDRIYEKFEDVYNKCRVCSMPRAKISGIRASVFGDVIFVDHCEIELKKKKYVVLLVLDGATNLLWATAQNSLDKKETL